MQRTDRQHDLDRACAKALPATGDYLVPDDILKTQMRRAVAPAPTQSELDESVRYMDGKRRIAGTQTERGTKWALTELGRAWLDQND